MRATPDSPKSDINVTPLVDVCLVLLIIFMVVTPMLANRDVKPPEAPRPESKKLDPERQLVLALRKGGLDPILDARVVPREDLLAALTAERRRRPEKDLVVLADHELTFAAIRSVLVEARRAGYPGALLLAERERIALRK